MKERSLASPDEIRIQRLKYAEVLLRSGRADEALMFYQRAALDLGPPPPAVPPAGADVSPGCALALAGQLQEAAAWFGLERKDGDGDGDARPIEIAADEVVVCSAVRNEAERLPFFLQHYRRLGVRRFLFVDNDSTDGTGQRLLGEPDVHLWHTACPFRVGRCGSAWFQVLLEAHAVDRWCLIVDADEILLYDGCESGRTLPALCAELDARGRRAMTAVLLDMYSDRALADTSCDPGADPLAVCPYFDRQWYHYRQTLSGPHKNQTLYRGGLRRRVFGDDDQGQFWLQKAPLVRYARGTTLYPGQHWTGAAPDEIADETGCLLHFKYLAGFAARAAEEAGRGEHANGAREYRRYARVLAGAPDLVLHDAERSVRLTGGSAQLAKLGILRGRAGPPAPDRLPAIARASAPAGVLQVPAGGSRVLIYADCPRIYGAEQINHAIARGLSADGLRITFVQSFADNALVEERRALGIDHLWLEFDTVEDSGEGCVRARTNDVEAARIFDEARPDLVVFADGLPVSSLAAKRVAAERGLPFVLIQHLGELDSWPAGEPLPVGALATAYAQARAVVAVCAHSLRSLRAGFALPPDKGQVIYNGRGPAFFRPPAPATRRRVRHQLGIPEDAVVSLTTARFDLSKGYQYQLAAVAALKRTALWPRLYFLWAGTGRDAPTFQAAIDLLGLGAQVRLLGERDDVPDLLDTADLFLLPSRREALPLSVLEAMAKGLPVAASAVNGLPEALGETGRLLPDPRSDAQGLVNVLVETVQAWAGDEPLRRAVGGACRARAQQRFGEERMLDEYRRVIRAALETPAGARPC